MAGAGLACCLIPELQIQHRKRNACSILNPITTWSSRLSLAPLGAGAGLHKQISQRLIQQGDGVATPVEGPFTLALGVKRIVLGD